MRYEFEVALDAWLSLIENHPNIFSKFDKDALDVALNWYYKKILFLRYKGDAFLFFDDLVDDMEQISRLTTEHPYIDEMIAQILRFESTATSPSGKEVYAKLQRNFVDIFRYGIDNPEKSGNGLRNLREKASKSAIFFIFTKL